MVWRMGKGFVWARGGGMRRKERCKERCKGRSANARTRVCWSSSAAPAVPPSRRRETTLSWPFALAATMAVNPLSLLNASGQAPVVHKQLTFKKAHNVVLPRRICAHLRAAGRPQSASRPSPRPQTGPGCAPPVWANDRVRKRERRPQTLGRANSDRRRDQVLLLHLLLHGRCSLEDRCRN